MFLSDVQKNLYGVNNFDYLAHSIHFLWYTYTLDTYYTPSPYGFGVVQNVLDYLLACWLGTIQYTYNLICEVYKSNKFTPLTTFEIYEIC